MFPEWKPIIPRHNKWLISILIDKYVGKDKSSDLAKFVNSQDGMDFMLKETYKELFEHAFETPENVYILDERISVNKELENFYKNPSTKNMRNLLNLASKGESAGFLLTKNSPWKCFLDLAIMELNGVKKKNLYYLEEPTNNQLYLESVSLGRMFVSFFVILFGIFVSLLILIFEVVTKFIKS